MQDQMNFIFVNYDIRWKKTVFLGIFSIIKTTYNIDFFTVKILDTVLTLPFQSGLPSLIQKIPSLMLPKE